MVNVKEAFTAKHQGNVNVSVEEVSFDVGEEVQVIKEWADETCLVKKDDKIFNVSKKYLALE